ncbi:MAG: hypothetical protein KBD16_03105 [Candidatus Pacebacteria bacterium]|nr:hypothetical protein [Candidatus Paceibacterota bacterium]
MLEPGSLVRHRSTNNPAFRGSAVVLFEHEDEGSKFVMVTVITRISFLGRLIVWERWHSVPEENLVPENSSVAA